MLQPTANFRWFHHTYEQFFQMTYQENNCSCHPEHRIKELIKNKELADFIKEYCYKDIFKDISELVTNYEPKIAKGIYED